LLQRGIYKSFIIQNTFNTSSVLNAYQLTRSDTLKDSTAFYITWSKLVTQNYLYTQVNFSYLRLFVCFELFIDNLDTTIGQDIINPTILYSFI